MNPDRTNTLIHALSAWIDQSPDNLHRDPEALLWGRVAKVAEEAGEAINALVGVTGQNPRKGRSATRKELEYELLDVALTALTALAHLRADEPEPAALLDLLAGHAEAVARRAGLA
ncbi:MazG-like family protein [Nonomuraea roseoviolacea]|uniref:NTP pyrophosphatase (Non-canonical NTP hydrolase) n=1 Tax=Nonomuraea roseoviolacea subsp. carminata TaxID=160689 RepID=A0ABT1K8J1_9ACTN|nr:MazG-like family protein [Nonomuraea roseoviolacea]MCP2350324.1 NTP pyrophosphatase (non-canonical NTP hydrolase) [Nonomuraea roseoviolacea subsp. carminata]